MLKQDKPAIHKDLPALFDGQRKDLQRRWTSGVAFQSVRFLMISAIACTWSANAFAQSSIPDNAKGWWYFIDLNNHGYVASALEACQRTAVNHMGRRLRYMEVASEPIPAYRCFYPHFLRVGGVQPYTTIKFYCKIGYAAKWPGVCVKRSEISRPPGDSPGDAGLTCGNPVAVSSGAKIQTETDQRGLPNGLLHISRTYRTLREVGQAQSAGQGWSFSFDRHFSEVVQLQHRAGDPPSKFKGAFGDGTYFEFYRDISGAYVSRYDKRETLKSLSPAFDDWALTTRDGRIERFKKIDGQYLLVSVHSKNGTGEFYTYGAEGKLATISDASGHALTITWVGAVVSSVTGAAGSVRYDYELIKADDDLDVGGTERLAAVSYLDEDGRQSATRRYHYEDANHRHLLTGITDENGNRFATYAYNASGQAILSEHAGGANRYEFSYPEEAKRVVTDPLDTQRVIDLVYDSENGGTVSSVSQPGGAGSGPAASNLSYDDLGRLSSSTNYDGKKTCFIREATRGLVTSEVSGLTAAAACPASGTASISAISRRVTKQWHPDVELVSRDRCMTNRQVLSITTSGIMIRRQGDMFRAIRMD